MFVITATTPRHKAEGRVRGQVRGSHDLSVSAAQCQTLGKGKQTVLACGQGGLSRVALAGQGIAWNRTGRDGRRLIDAAHYFQPRKTGMNTKDTMATGGRGQGKAFISQALLLNKPHKNMNAHINKHKVFNI